MAEPPDGNTGETTGLLFSVSRDFATLEAYLAYLERRGATGFPWYRKVAPDLYELISGRRPRVPAVRVTRAELMQRYGFDDEANA